MTLRTPRLALVALVVLALSACSAANGAGETAVATGGSIELAVSETCAEGADTQCVSVNGENVVLPSAFERAGVENATVADGEGQNAVDVTFDQDGAGVWQALTEKAARAGEPTRLVIKIGGEIQSAVVVMQALEGDQAQIALAPGDSAQDVVDLIHAG